MKQIEVSDCTNQRLQELKDELYGSQLDDDSFLFLLSEEILDE